MTFSLSPRMHRTHPPHRRPRGRLVVATAAAGLMTAGLTLVATPAGAHVRVFADTTTSGSFSALTFRVPNESDTASTVKLSVELPQDTPLLYVSSKPVSGWKATVTEAPLPKPVESYGTTLTKAVRTVTWTADRDSAIAPGQYQEFSLSVGPLPDAGTILLPAKQTYSDGEVVSWDQPETAGGEEPEHPAPALVVTAKAADTPASSADPSTATSTAPTTAPASVSTDGSDGVARGLAGGALAVSVAALIAAVAALRRRSGVST